MLFQNFEKIIYTVIVNPSVAIHSYLSECLQSTVYPCHLTLLQELHLDLQVKPNFAVLKRVICFPCTIREQYQKKSRRKYSTLYYFFNGFSSIHAMFVFVLGKY